MFLAEEKEMDDFPHRLFNYLMYCIYQCGSYMQNLCCVTGEDYA